MRQMLAKEQQFKARRRANSESTEVPPTFNVDPINITESFQDMEMNGVGFNTVKLFYPRSGALLVLHFDELMILSV